MTSRDVVDELVRHAQPSADIAALRACARRLETIAARTEVVGRDFSAAHARPGLCDGGLREGVDDNVRAIAGPRGSAVADVVTRLGALVATLDRYADEVAGTCEHLSLASAIAERDLMRAEVASLVGHPTAIVAATGAATSVVGAIGDDAVERAARIDPATAPVRSSDVPAAHDDSSASAQAPGAQAPGTEAPGTQTSGTHAPTMSGAGLPAMAAAVPMAAAMTRAFTGHADSPVAVDGERLAERARQLYSSLPPDLAQWVRMSVGVGCTPAREMIAVVGTSDPVPYLRTGVTIGAGEHLAGSARGSELAIAEQLEALGARPLAVASAHPVPAEVIAYFDDLGVPVIAPAAAPTDPDTGPGEFDD
ncbi:hypothetical protein [Gordonia sp. (in: high G+C Gram-positive bacteria)]|uniref:hypothetical protein n=1 Tax=Gordonia sp. (in: high G+C Gram-positive bacteria) TaxID=84139 RepID=UPI001DF68820|nr:hypothetical protein [Gordonia sp. (in: high G+C Gram-positive bacteria)]MCB1295018.1 hypothetical protein [Gordonia sp. (in: high G+C Gram-positive bacteria)]HMS76866.1 hypothetical protein [Gordonia sp. (in: high G+C Gram-positive bacteria)]